VLLEDRVAIVTGGAKGIGRGIALKFAQEGGDVAVCARHIEGAEQVAAEIVSHWRSGPIFLKVPMLTPWWRRSLRNSAG